MASIASIPRSLFHRPLGQLVLSIVLLASTTRAQIPARESPSAMAKATSTQPTLADAKRFIEQAETRLLDLWIKSARASWVAQNFITDDTEAISADADQAVKAATDQLANEAKPYEK